MKMRFAVGMNRNERMDEIAGHARVAEESGFDFVTYVDQPFMSRDVFASMTIAALNTHRIHMGPGVLDLTTHHCEKIQRVGELGIRTIATVTYPLGDKKGMLREIGDKVMIHFRN